MKKTYHFSEETDFFEADENDLKNRLNGMRQLLENYREVECDLDSDSYVARGNGFCDAKYSEDFIEGRIADIEGKIRQLEIWLAEC